MGLINEAVGRVLEIDSGTGVNFPFYEHAIQVDAIEPNPLMSNQSLVAIQNACIPIELHTVSAEELPFADNTFDSVVATLVFCTIPEPAKALQEIRRVSKKGAKLLLFEHVRMDQKLLGKAQDLLNPLWARVADGCQLNRNTLDLLKQSGFTITKVDSYYKDLFLYIECLNEE
ncbi:methyltransferase domain-containing protein [Filibacter tadaridae]|uniref:Putative methyltransferase YcgJ n=1 Tax=Filibacter tadaridae TaxID=2483811 RepID=A0A3P5WY58_9BACL|nr:putative methyltransferase YcgJ [Filibacter tadaridae]